MQDINNKLDKYIEDHTEPEDELLFELNRQTNLNILRPRMLSGHVQGKLLTMFSNMIKPVNILELGTYTGYSAICLAKGLQEGGELHTIDVDDEIEDFTRSYIERSGLSDRIKYYIGSALEVIPTIDVMFDLVFIDADKSEYLDYYKLVFDKVNPGGYILADNVLWSGKVVEELDSRDFATKAILEFNDYVHNDSRVENVLLPIRDGLMILRKK